MEGYSPAGVHVLYIIPKGITDGVAVGDSGMLRIETSVGDFPRACWAALASAISTVKCFTETPMTVELYTLKD